MRIGIAGPFNPYEFRNLFSTDEIPNINQNASAVQALVMSFLDEGHHVIVFTINPVNKSQVLRSENLIVYLIPYRLIPRTSIFQFYFVYNLRKCIRKNLKDIDVLHSQWTYEYAFAAKAFSKEVPVFCTVRDWCPIIMNLPMTLLGKFGWRVIKYNMFRKVMSTSDIHFIANSSYTYSRIESEYPEKEVTIIPNSIKKEYILTKEISPLQDVVIISIANGITNPRKNIISLLKAFRLLRNTYEDATLFIVGKTSKDDPIYKQWKEDSLLNRVIMTGPLSHDEVISYLDQSSIMVHPSLEETFGNTLLEAMARRVPVIGGKDSGAVPTVLGNGKYGICCDVTSPEEIVNAIIFLLDKKNAEQKVNAATGYLLDKYASDVVCIKHIELYMNYLASEKVD